MMGEFFIPGLPIKVPHVTDAVVEALQFLSYTDHETFAIRLLLEEAMVYAIRHGNEMDPDKRVHVVFRADADRFDVRVTDEGPGFMPEVPDVITHHMIDSLRGRARLLFNPFGIEVRFRGRGNVVAMSRLRTAAS